MAKLITDLVKGTWSSIAPYTIGDIVTYLGSSYICIVNNTGQLPTNTAYWVLLAQKGDIGNTGATGPTGPQGTGAPVDTDPTLAANLDTNVASQKATKSFVNAQVATIPTNGWNPIAATFTYTSTDGHIFVLGSDTDLTGAIGIGDKIKLTNNATTFYGFVVAITASTITVYGGQNYTITNAAITIPFYSHAKSPVGFDTNPVSWTEVLTDNSDQVQSSPTQNTWYNLGSLSIAIPIGKWSVEYYCTQYVTKAGATTVSIESTLSTTNNSESDADFSNYSLIGGATGSLVVIVTAHRQKILTLASRTTYYLNALTDVTGAAAIHHNGTVGKTIIRAVCAYL